MRELNSREKIIALVTVSVIAIFVVNKLIITPLRDKADEFDTKLTKTEVSLKKHQSLLDQDVGFGTAYDQAAQSFQQQRSDDEEVADVISVVQSVAANNGMKIETATAQPVKTVDFYKEFAAEITFDATWEKLPQFLYRLQNPPNSFDVKQITIDKDPLNPESALKCRLVVSRIYLLPVDR